MPSRARVVLAGLALSLVAGLALLASVALRSERPAPATPTPSASVRPPPDPEFAGDLATGAPEDSRDAVEAAPGSAARVGLAADEFAETLPWSGRVADAEGGGAIEGAEVELAAGERVRTTRTDADGRFELAWPVGLSARLAIRHPRYVDAAAARVDLGREGRFALERSAALRGNVLPAGVEGTVTAWLQSASSERLWPSLDAPLAADGRFAFEDLTPGEYLVAARVTGRAVAPESGLRLEAGQELELLLRARDGARVLGRALSEPGRTPVAGLRVTAELRDDDLPRDWLRDGTLETASDADGRFEFAGLGTGTWRLTGHGDGGQRPTREFEVTGSGERHEVELALALAAALGGRVVDAAGAGVAGCEVATFGSSNGAGAFLSGAGEPQAWTDEQGWFRIEGLAPNNGLTVVARTPLAGGVGPERYGRTTVPELAPGANQLGVLVELRPSGSVSGRVLSSAGAPIAALVRAHVRVDARSTSTATAQADADGRFRFERLPGPAGYVEAEAEGWRRGGVESTFDGGEIELRLEAAHALEGWAVDAQGLAVAGVPITVQPVTTDGNERAARRQRRSATSDDTGHFRFEDLRPGTWEVRGGSYAWRLAGAELRTVEIPTAEALELVFERDERPASATIEGEAALPSGAAPTGIELEGLRGGVLTVESGRFRVTGVTPALQRLTLRADGHARVPLEPFELAPGGVFDVGRVLLEPATHLVVRVRAQGGGDLDGARVRLLPLPVDQGGAGPEARALRLDATRRGRYETTDATRHAWQLVVDRPGHERHTRRLEVLAEERQVVEVGLEPDS